MRKIFISTLICAAALLSAAPLRLAENGKTAYKIVVPAKATEVDKFAAKELQFFLKKISGADFQIVNTAQTPAIFIGDAKSKTLADQVNVIETRGKNLHLYGGGLHGTIWAVYELIENQFGCIFFNAHGELYIPQQKTLLLNEMKKTTRYAFPARAIMNWFYADKETMTLAFYRNRQNILLHGITQPRYPGKNPGIVTRFETFVGEHSFSMLIPSGLKKQSSWISHNAALPFLRNKQYFKEHPEYFSLDANGKRVPNWHLCLSNPALRKELTKNAVLFYEAEKKRTGIEGVIQISANDIATRLCYCKNCVALEKKYGTKGGPLYDFTIEIARKYPHIPFRTTAYQRSLTQTPPNIKLNWPKNLQLIFAPINGDYARSWESNKFDRTDYKDFTGWAKITRNILVWHYPCPYNRDRDKFFIETPNFMLDRLAGDIRTMAKEKIEGSYFEHDSGGIQYGTNFSELQAYVMLKLFQNPALDADKLADKYIFAYYGPAAKAVKKYHDSLASAMRDFVKRGGKWNYRSMDSDFLNSKNLLAWDKMMDEAEKVATGIYAFRTRLLRLGLDSTIVTKLDDQTPMRLKRMRDMLTELGKVRKVKINWKGFDAWSKNMTSRGKVLPLPAEFVSLKKTIVMETPEKGKTIVNCAGANLNRAFKENFPVGKKFNMGLYDRQAKRQLVSRAFNYSDVKQGSFNWYLLSKTPRTITRDTVLNGGSWWLNFNVGTRCILLDDTSTMKQKWYFFVSLKADKETLYCDRILIVPAENLPANLKKDLLKADLPTEFAGAKNVIIFNPAGKFAVKDAASVSGVAIPEIWDGKAKFNMGIYGRVRKKYGYTRRLAANEVPVDGKYHLICLNKTPSSLEADDTLFGGRWVLIFRVGDKAVKGAKYQIWLSLKRDNGKVLCSGVYLVER